MTRKFDPKVTEEFICENRTTAKLEESANSAIVVIDAIHVGTTKNFVDYTREALKGAIKTWTKPTGKPVLKNHDDSDVDNTIGRVKRAEYVEDNGGLTRLTAKIDDPEAIQKIHDERYLNVSIGSSIVEARCSICGGNLIEKFCGHWRGEKYDRDGNPSTAKNAETCKWVVTKVKHDEVSVVACPADEKARIISLITESEQTFNTLEIIGGEDVLIEESEVKTDNDGIEEEDMNNPPAELSDDCFIDTPAGKFQYKDINGVNADMLNNTIASIRTSDVSTIEKALCVASLKSIAVEAGIEIVEQEEDSSDNTIYDRIKELEAVEKSLKDENRLLELQVEELSKSINKLECKLATSLKENSNLINEKVTIKEEVHNERVERLVDLKYVTNRESRTNREEVVKEYSGKSDNVLLELINEYSTTVKLATPPAILNETLPMKTAAESDIVKREVDVTKLIRPDKNTVRLAINGNKEAQEIVKAWDNI